MEFWWFTPPYPGIAPLHDTVKIGEILVLTGGVISPGGVTVALIYAIRKSN